MEKRWLKLNNDQFQILVQAILDTSVSTSNINKELEKLKLNPIKVSTILATSDIKSEIEKATKVHKPKISADLDINKQSITDLQKQIENVAKTQNINWSIDNKPIDEATVSWKQLKEQMIDTYKSQKQEAKELQDASNLKLDKENLGNKMQTWLNENSRAVKSLGSDVDELINRLKSADRVEYNNINREFRNLKSSAEQLGVAGRTVGDEFLNSVKKFSSWFFIGGMVSSAVRDVQKMITTVQELDKSIVDLQIASGFNRNQVTELMDTYNQLGQRMGATTIEVAKSADSWLRQGYSIEQTNKLIEASMMLSKLGQIESAEATQYLTSSLKGYKLSVEDATNVVSKLTAVDMEAAVSAGGIAEALARTANGAEIAGVSIDKLIGYIATVGEVTQRSLSTVGESFKTIFARMGNIKLGKFIDDESGEDLSDVEKTLSHLDIILRETSGTFRNFGDVLDEVGGRWSSFNDVEKNAIAVAFAGVRQRENFLVLMENYGNALKYTETAATSFGTATEKMKVYEDGLEASTKRATAAFEALSSTVINSDFLKGAVDTGTGLLGAVNWLLKNLGTIPILIGGITAAMSIKSNTGEINSKLPLHVKVA